MKISRLISLFNLGEANLIFMLPFVQRVPLRSVLMIFKVREFSLQVLGHLFQKEVTTVNLQD